MAATAESSGKALTPRRPLSERTGLVYAAQIGIVLAIFFLWEGAVRADWIEARAAGQPSRIWALFVQSLSSGELLAHLQVTIYDEILGFALVLAGVPPIGDGKD